MKMMLAIPLLVVGIVGSFLHKSFLSQVVAFFGFLSLYQALDRTCVAHAARGTRSIDGQVMALRDTALVEYFQKRSRKIYIKTFFSTLILILAGRAWLHWYG